MSGRKSGSSGAPLPPPPKRVWQFFKTGPDAASPAMSEFRDLPDDIQGELRLGMERYRDGTSRKKDIKNLGDGILELRERRGNNHYRVLFTVCKTCLVALTAFYKNQQQTPKHDLDRAKRRAGLWRRTFGD